MNNIRPDKADHLTFNHHKILKLAPYLLGKQSQSYIQSCRAKLSSQSKMEQLESIPLIVHVSLYRTVSVYSLSI